MIIDGVVLSSQPTFIARLQDNRDLVLCQDHLRHIDPSSIQILGRTGRVCGPCWRGEPDEQNSSVIAQ